ncbi:MAG: type VI secretion system protein TssA [Burkholderiaceae bacterium]|nr:type VI secretion system protein TssA [Burkholderiaceae bacterium]
MIDVDALVSPLEESNPCGENLEYDPDFMSLEAAARGKPDQEFGDTRIEAEEPDWKSIEEGAVALLGRTRDLRPTMLLVRALTRGNGVAGLAQGIELLARLVAELWEPLHPQLDPDDDDPIMRINALSALVDERGLLRDLRAAQFVSAPGFGPCSVRQAEGALGLLDSAGESGALSLVQLQGMVRDAAGRGVPNHAQIALDHLRALVRTLDDRVGSDRSLDAKPLIARLAPLAGLWAGATGADVAGESQSDGPSTVRPSAGRGGGIGELRSREDAIRLLGTVCEFLERSEPTNPAPLLIRRAQRVMTMSFVDIMREMAPEGMDSVSKIAGLASGGEGAES